jgi:hypothetical protein
MRTGAINRDISVVENTFTGLLWVIGGGQAHTDVKILIDHNTFDGIDVAPNDPEGRLQIYDGEGVVVSNNHFGRGAGGVGGDSDGIQMGGYGGTIGPGNVFDGIHLGPSGRHVDAMQLYGEVDHVVVTGNYYINGGSYLFAFTSPQLERSVTITNNVFVIGDYWPAVQIGDNVDATFVHNTSSVGVTISNPKNNVVRDNLMFGEAGFTFDHSGTVLIQTNLFEKPQDASRTVGTGAIFGIPSFVGGPKPTSRVGFKLLASSPGHLAGSDGLDLGAL